jgi:hypothetical protein
LSELPADERELLAWFSLVDRTDIPIPKLARPIVELDTIDDEPERTRVRRELGDRLTEVVRVAVVSAETA